MLRICTAALLATLLCAGAALARGGGGGGGYEPIPAVNFTDLPPFAPDYRVAPIWALKHGKAPHNHVRWH
jgi:hypothetical protein